LSGKAVEKALRSENKVVGSSLRLKSRKVPSEA
jgi:hypothetical protein